MILAGARFHIKPFVGFIHRLECACGFLEILLPLGILTKDFRPWRSKKHCSVVLKLPCGFFHMLRNGQVTQHQIADYVRNTAVEEDRPTLLFRHRVRAHFP